MKYKLTTLAFALSIAAVSIYGLLRPSYGLGLFLGLNTYFAQVRLMIAAILITYAFVPSIRLKVSQISLGLGGLVCLGVGVVAMVSPAMLGAFSEYMVIGDLVIAIESGVLAIILAAELPTKQSPRRTELLLPAYYMYRGAVKRLAPSTPQPHYTATSRIPKLDLIRKQTA